MFSQSGLVGSLLVAAASIYWGAYLITSHRAQISLSALDDHNKINMIPKRTPQDQLLPKEVGSRATNHSAQSTLQLALKPIDISLLLPAKSAFKVVCEFLQSFGIKVLDKLHNLESVAFAIMIFLKQVPISDLEAARAKEWKEIIHPTRATRESLLTRSDPFAGIITFGVPPAKRQQLGTYFKQLTGFCSEFEEHLKTNEFFPGWNEATFIGLLKFLYDKRTSVGWINDAFPAAAETETEAAEVGVQCEVGVFGQAFANLKVTREEEPTSSRACGIPKDWPFKVTGCSSALQRVQVEAFVEAKGGTCCRGWVSKEKPDGTPLLWFYTTARSDVGC
eukprot:gnl/MRDRNA2_/MRDRNA2_130983_c0_seq1.p1 gnl/MRDRNA2_/MRDRNA2_130983_c0~~gnl/MRDRNA2_/MRDRNA2_130983_c0_seq1.p1  ORF type:complete len:335 (+),score=46.99 gnl/MRDRNA2_/MRDRNA2_130983_c0_seq1:3-1007(+)